MDISEELKKILTENLLVREYKKGTVLLKKGDLCKECYFILKGLIRTYYIEDEREITTDFHMEEQVVSPSCYGTNIPSELFLECLEYTVACIGSPEMENKMYKNYPQLETLSRVMGEKIMSGYRDTLDSFKMLTPEQRYLKIVKTNPDLIQRVPLYQIASYLGIKPESLSRIRNRITRKS
jgi:CRP-like cAMP-binding protein